MAEVTVYYLEMLRKRWNELQPYGKPIPADFSVQEACIKQYQVNRMLYQLVGEGWEWNDKAGWTAEMWKDFAESQTLRTWIAYSKGSIAGYFELKSIDEHTNEIAYFGLANKFIGKGFGGVLLSEAVTQAWAWNKVERIIVNTCSLDHPNALANYQARGFSVYKEKKYPE